MTTAIIQRCKSPKYQPFEQGIKTIKFVSDKKYLSEQQVQ